MKPKMIFHVPYPLDPDSVSASGIRPFQMRRAFEEIGYEVIEVSGPASMRRRRIREAKRLVKAGVPIELVYSEASTKPTAMSESHSLPLHPFLDINFLSFCTKRGIPVGVFYRDIYWNSGKYLESVSKPVALLTRQLYRFDLARYRTAVKYIFLPSMRMAKEMPLTRIDQCFQLPPGANLAESSLRERDISKGGISLLYVGGLGSYYQMQETVKGVESCPGASLTICTREAEWGNVREDYLALIGQSTRVVHSSGSDLTELYKGAHIGVLLMEPISYREFAMPMKLYEYLAHGKPVIVTEGSLASTFVEEHGVGWALPYDAEALNSLLIRLQQDPSEYHAMRERALAVRTEQTWESRAEQAAAKLLDYQPARNF